jgi:hypothetical protein
MRILSPQYQDSTPLSAILSSYLQWRTLHKTKTTKTSSETSINKKEVENRYEKSAGGQEVNYLIQN